MTFELNVLSWLSTEDTDLDVLALRQSALRE